MRFKPQKYYLEKVDKNLFSIILMVKFQIYTILLF